MSGTGFDYGVKTGDPAAVDERARLQVCTVRVGPTNYGVPIGRILEVLGRAAVQQVPLAPAYIGGLVHYRGEVLTTVSLRSVLGMEPGGAVHDIVVFESAEGFFGLLVDAVGEVRMLSPESFEPNPSTLDDSRQALFRGAYKLEDGLLVMLDPQRLDPVRLGETLGGGSGPLPSA